MKGTDTSLDTEQDATFIWIYLTEVLLSTVASIKENTYIAWRQYFMHTNI